MGRKGNWFKTLKKALSPSSKRKKDQKTKLSRKQNHPNSGPTPSVIANQLSQPAKVKPTCGENENHCKDHRVPISDSTGMASTSAATQFVQAITETQFTRKSREEMAAIKIQSAFRGYLARSEIRALRRLLRLKSLVESFVVDRQAMNSIRCMQVFVRVHYQIRSRRLRKLEENQALQKRFLQKHAKELENFQVEKGWNDSTQSKEQVEAKLLSKHEAAMRRERALAYAFSQQKISRNSSRSINPLFTDPNNPTWGWSWLERSVAAQQWGEGRSSIARGELNKANVQFELSSQTSSPTVSQSESRRYTFQPLSPSSRRRSVAEPKKLKSSSRKKNSVPEIQEFGLTLEANSLTASRPQSPRYTFQSLLTPSPQRSVAWGRKLKQLGSRNNSPDDDYKSLESIQSNKSLMRCNGGPRSSVWDDESETRSSILPSYMTLTESSRAKSRLHGPIEMENSEAREITSFSSSAKKHLVYPPSPTKSRRYSDCLKVDHGVYEENGKGRGRLYEI